MTRCRIAVLVIVLALGGGVRPAGAQVDANTMRAHFIDVGQGDATLLEFACGVVLIDAGGQTNRSTADLVAYLRGVFANRPELHDTIRTLFITHNHFDHTAALEAVIQAFHVRRVIENGQRAPKKPDGGDRVLQWVEGYAHSNPARFTLRDVDETEVVQAQEGLSDDEIDPVNCPGTDPDIRVLAADRDANPNWRATDFEDKNNHSVVVRVAFGHATFLFTGDLEVPAIDLLVQEYAGSGLLDVDIYHAGHHGAENGTTAGLLTAIARPELVIISMGACDERGGKTARGYGHPREATIKLLRRAVTRQRPTSRRVYVAHGIDDFYATTMRDAIYGTGWDGTIIVTATTAGTYSVASTGRPVPPSC